MEDARNISEELGYTTVKSRSRTVPGVMGGGKRSPSTNVSDQRRALMLPQEIKEMPADRQLLFVEHVLPVKCHKIKYFDDPISRNGYCRRPVLRSTTCRSTAEEEPMTTSPCGKSESIEKAGFARRAARHRRWAGQRARNKRAGVAESSRSTSVPCEYRRADI